MAGWIFERNLAALDKAVMSLGRSCQFSSAGVPTMMGAEYPARKSAHFDRTLAVPVSTDVSRAVLSVEMPG